MTDTVVAEGQVKFRDGKKWKSRWVVLRKPSPVADCLSLLVYKEKKKGKEKASSHKERLNVALEGICGVEPGPGYDGVSFTLSILCLVHTLVLGFSSRDALAAWDARIRYSLGEVHRFSVNIEPGTKLESGPASLHLCNGMLVLTRGVPPLVIGHWKLSLLRRYGAVPDGFVFEGGTRCGNWAGVYFLSCGEGEQISFLFDCIVRGINPSRGPHGLRPSLPADPNADPSSEEERISQETSELEKRLSMLSHCSLASITASTYSCITSVAGDDRSSISSSSSSQSDISYGGKLPFWVEPLARHHHHLSSETASSSSTLKALTGSDDRLYAAVAAGCGPTSSALLRPRGLHDSGRQSSLDSGIGIAAGSQSSYSGSYSSGSLDMNSQAGGGGEEFGSVVSLPAAPPPPASPPPAPPPTPPPSPLQPTLCPDVASPRASSSCSCSSSRAPSRRHSGEYQIPNLLRLWYDTPRSFLQALTQRGAPSAQGAPAERGRGSKDGGGDRGHAGLPAQRQATMQRSLSWGSERAPSVDSEGSSTPTPLLLHGGSTQRDSQCSRASDYSVTSEQWRSAKSAAGFQADNSSSSRLQSTPAGIQVRSVGVTDAQSDCRDEGWKLKSLLSYLPPSSPPPPPPLATMSARKSSSGVFQPSREAPPPAHADAGDSIVNYVNVNSLWGKSREPIDTEAELQEGVGASSSYATVRDEGFMASVHPDLRGTYTAQRVGTEHLEDRLTLRGPLQ